MNVASPAMISETDFRQWASAYEPAFQMCRGELQEREGHLAENLLVRHVGQGAATFLGNPAFARSATIEDLDCKVSRGCLMTVEREETMSDRSGGAVRGRVTRGTETGRILDLNAFRKAEWLGSDEFYALSCGILHRRCVREIEQCFGFVRPMMAVAEPAEEADSFSYNLATAVAPEDSAQAREHIVFELARFSESLCMDRQRAAAETVDAILEVLRRPDGPVKWERDHFLFWEAVGEELELNEDALAQRKKRFFEQLMERREQVSPYLLLRARRMLAEAAVDAVEGCRRVLAVAGGRAAERLRTVRDFFLFSIARQHPIYSRRPMAAWREMDAAKLAGLMGRVHLAAWPPDAAEFAGFCELQGLSVDRFAADMTCLADDLRVVRPRPARLLGTLRQVFGPR